MDAKQQFIEEYAPIAEEVGDKIGVSSDILLSQWGLETRWGTSIVGNHNLGNIKDFAGGGKEAKGEKYLNFEDPEAFGDYYAHMIKRNFPGALNAKSDLNQFVKGLQSGKKGAYAEDENYGKSLSGALATTQSIYEAPKDGASKDDEKTKQNDLIDRAIAGGAGAVTGITLGSAFPDKGFSPQSMAGLERKQIGQQALLSELEKELSRIPESARRAPPFTPNAPPISLDVPEAPDSQTGLERQLQGTIEDGQTGRARQTGYQELTAQQAARQREMAETENMLRQRGVISGRSPFLNFPIASSPTGILVPPGVAAEAAIPEAQAQAQTQQANQLEKQISDTRRNLAVTQQTIAELNRRAPGPLAKAGAIFRSPAAKMIPGIGAGLGVEEAKRRYESGDYPGAVLAGSGALGSGLMMLPTAPGPVGAATKGLGALMGYGGGLGLFLRDLLLRKQEEQAAKSQISATR